MITDYGSLKTTVQEYLGNRNETTLVANIPSFIQMGSLQTFRRLRVFENEVEYTYGVGDLPPGEEVFAELPLPPRYKELKFLLANGEPLTRKSDIAIQSLLYKQSAQGSPEYFGRVARTFKLWRVPDTYYEMSCVYWEDQTSLLVNDDDTHDCLIAYPDLFLYGTLLQAAPYMIDDERIPAWKTLYNDAMALALANDDEESESGSNVAVSGVGGDY